MKRVWKIIIRLFLLTLISGLVGFSYSYYEARNLKTRRYVFNHSDIPSSFVGKTLVLISDIHCNQYFTGDDVSKLVTHVNAMEPDIVVLLGDNTNVDTVYSIPFFREMKKLTTKYGVYSVLGNHDYWEDLSIIQAGIASCGFNISDNQSFWLHEGSDSIKIGGVGDLWEDEQLIDNTIHDVSDNDFCILLSHNPDYIEQMETNKIDLMLSGHTHGGQVTLFGLYAPIMPSHWKPNLPNTGQKYRSGWKKVNETQLYVTTGVGMGNFPFRFFAQPEVVEITLQNK